MKRPVIKTALALALIMAVCIAVFISANVNPWLYTKLYGDAGTERLYQLYRLSQKGVRISRVREFADANRLAVIVHEKDNMLSAHNDSETNSEEVYIWYAGEMTTKARFTINNP